MIRTLIFGAGRMARSLLSVADEFPGIGIVGAVFHDVAERGDEHQGAVGLRGIGVLVHPAAAEDDAALGAGDPLGQPSDLLGGDVRDGCGRIRPRQNANRAPAV